MIGPPLPVQSEALARLAAWGHPDAPPLIAPPPGTAALFCDDAIAARLSGPLLLASSLGELALADEDRARVATMHRRMLMWCLRLEQQLLEADGWFRSEGISYLVVKGPAIAHLDELEPSLRTFADIDLLVAADDLDRAVAILLAHGATRPWLERRPRYDHRFAKSVTLTFPDGVEVDLHRSLCDGVHGFRIPLDRLFAEAGQVRIGGTALQVPSHRHRLLHAAYHAVLGSPRPSLMSLRDLGGYLTDRRLDVDDVSAEAVRWRGEAVLARAVRLTAATLSLPCERWSAWAGEGQSKREDRLIDRQRTEGSGLGIGKVQAMRELPTLPLRVAYARALVMPSAAHLRSRGMRRRDLWLSR